MKSTKKWQVLASRILNLAVSINQDPVERESAQLADFLKREWETARPKIPMAKCRPQVKIDDVARSQALQSDGTYKIQLVENRQHAGLVDFYAVEHAPDWTGKYSDDLPKKLLTELLEAREKFMGRVNSWLETNPDWTLLRDSSSGKMTSFFRIDLTFDVKAGRVKPINPLPPHLYHYTFEKDWGKIQREGLIPKPSEAGRIPESRTHLTGNLSTLKYILKNSYGLGSNNQIILITIDPTKINQDIKVYPDPEFNALDHKIYKSYWTSNTIPSSAISHHRYFKYNELMKYLEESS